MSSVKFSTEVQIRGILVAFSFNCLNFILFDDSTSLQVRENLLFSPFDYVYDSFGKAHCKIYSQKYYLSFSKWLLMYRYISQTSV